MISLRRLTMTVFACALALVPAAAGLAASPTRPDAETQSSTQVGPDHVTLQGKVNPHGAITSYHFEYGTTTAYGQSTPVESAGSGTTWASVAETAAGLTPSTKYHFRIVATNALGTKNAGDKTFTTSASDGTPAPTPAPTDGSGSDPQAGSGSDVPSGSGSTGSGSTGSGSSGSGADSVADGGSSDTEQVAPTLGHSVEVDPVDGVVQVRRPTDESFGALEPGHTVPTGSVIDARYGKVILTTAVTAGTTQTGTFWGGVFEVRQSRDGQGYADIHLRGASLADCPRKPKLAAASAKRRRVASLWGSDRGGRFRTHGRNSVATVRGTQWLTTDRCNGTLTFVREGAVAVSDLHRHGTVLVRAGHAYLARAPR